MKKRRNVITCTGGGGRALPAKLGVEDVAFLLSSRTRFGICSMIPVVRNVGQTLNQVQGDKFLSLRADECRRGNPVNQCSVHKWIATLPLVARNDRGVLARGLAFTMAARLCRSTESRAIKGLCAYGRRIAFTMAEILLSLTIIGVVAAITLPSLTGNINERTWNTQRKALYARFSQAIALMPSLNQYSDVDTFLASGLAKVLKINNICDKDHLPDCGITTAKITDAMGNQLLMPKTIEELSSKNVNVAWSLYSGGPILSYSGQNGDAAAFETANGESVVAFYNNTCQSDMQDTDYLTTRKVCANFIYDLNGTKGPNTVGKDIGVITVLYPTDSVVAAPMPYLRNSGVEVTFAEAPAKCTELGDEYRAPNIAELMSMTYNQSLLNIENMLYWTTSRYDSSKAWVVSGTTGRVFLYAIDNTTNMRARCVKR